MLTATCPSVNGTSALTTLTHNSSVAWASAALTCRYANGTTLTAGGDRFMSACAILGYPTDGAKCAQYVAKDPEDATVETVAEYLAYLGVFGAGLVGLCLGYYMTASRRRSIVEVTS